MWYYQELQIPDPMPGTLAATRGTDDFMFPLQNQECPVRAKLQTPTH